MGGDGNGGKGGADDDSGGDDDLTQINANMARIDLCAEFVGPILAGLLLSYCDASTLTGFVAAYAAMPKPRPAHDSAFPASPAFSVH